MTLNIQKFERVPFDVDAVLITDENMREAAEWCSGQVRLEGPTNLHYIKVNVNKPLSPRQTKAFAGDRIVFANNGFKVYTPEAFNKTFVLKNKRKKSHGRRGTPSDFGSRQEVKVTKTLADEQREFAENQIEA